MPSDLVETLLVNAIYRADAEMTLTRAEAIGRACREALEAGEYRVLEKDHPMARMLTCFHQRGFSLDHACSICGMAERVRWPLIFASNPTLSGS